jgi:ATP synthase in type III secretion protein N
MTAAPARPADLLLVVSRLRQSLRIIDTRPLVGRVTRVTGTLVHAIVPDVRLGEICLLRDPSGGQILEAEVVGLDGPVAILTPLGEVEGLSTRTEVVSTGHSLQIPVGSALLGRVVDSLGRPLDGNPLAPLPGVRLSPVHASSPSALSRGVVDRPINLGIRAIDGLLTCGEGQRFGIYGEPGTGKSSLVAQIVKNADVDVTVIALIGERGREVREFIERHLTTETRARSVIVVATSDRSAIERVKAAHTATTIAEHFRDAGGRVLLVQDSVTRFARALREIGLAAGEPPTRRGFPPSVFAALPALLERSGQGALGSITAFYTILIEGDGTADPIAEETRSILDGHIVLSTKLAQAGQHPAIDVTASLSRVMDHIVTADHRAAASRIRELLARYAEVEFLLQVGEYKPGADPTADEAIGKREAIKAFLAQPTNQCSPWDNTLDAVKRLAS